MAQLHRPTDSSLSFRIAKIRNTANRDAVYRICELICDIDDMIDSSGNTFSGADMRNEFKETITNTKVAWLEFKNSLFERQQNFSQSFWATYQDSANYLSSSSSSNDSAQKDLSDFDQFGICRCPEEPMLCPLHIIEHCREDTGFYAAINVESSTLTGKEVEVEVAADANLTEEVLSMDDEEEPVSEKKKSTFCKTHWRGKVIVSCQQISVISTSVF